MSDAKLGIPRQSARTRRHFLRISTTGGLALAMPQWLPTAAATELPKPRARAVILVYLGGGVSHLDSFDPKPKALAEIRGKYRPIDTCVPGVTIGELLPRIAKSMDKLALVRSVSHDCNHHEAASNWMLSGRFGSPHGEHPAIGAVVARESGSQGPLPAYVAVPRNPSFTWELGTSAFLGPRYESFAAEPAKDDEKQHSTYDQLRARAAAMPACCEGRQAFAIEQEDAKTRDRYGPDEFAKNCLLARRLVERGVRFVTVSVGGWDHHANIFQSLECMLPRFDRAFSALIDDLHARGLLEQTLVVACGEFGRAPVLNADGGRDHWPAAASLLMAGAGVRGGQVIGKTDRHGACVIDQPVSPADLAYSIYRALGIDPRELLTAPDGRRQAILDQGGIIEVLFSA